MKVAIVSERTKRQLQQRWNSISTWVDARSLGQRLGLFAAIATLLIATTDQLFLHAASVQAAAQGKQLARDLAAARKLQSEIARMDAQAVADPDAQNRERLKLLQEQEAAARDAIAALSHDLVPPEQMVSMLESMLARQDKLRLVSLAKLPVQGMDAGQATAAGEPGARAAQAGGMVYKHGVEIVLQGQYLDLMNYLDQLEKLPVRLVWGSLALRANAYPVSTLTLTLYTLSLEKQWLHI